MTSPLLARLLDVGAEAPNGGRVLEDIVLGLAAHGVLERDDNVGESLAWLGDRLPTGWRWSSLRQLCEVVGGATPSKARSEWWEGVVPWVSPKDMKTELISDSIDHLSDQAVAASRLAVVPAGSLLVVVRGMILAHSLPVAITAVPVTINQDMKALVPRTPAMTPYLLLLMRAFKAAFLKGIQRSTHGTCKMPTDHLLDLALPLPPIYEQKRIIDRVEELSMQIDRFSDARAVRDAARHRALAACVGAVRTSETREHARMAWSRLARSVDHLVVEPQNCEVLRQLVIDLAVAGRLLPRRSRGASETSTLGRHATFQTGYAFESSWYVTEGVRVARNQNVGHGTIDWSEERRIGPDRATAFHRFALADGDILLSLDRPIIKSGLKVARVTASDLPALLLQRVARPQYLTSDLLPDYLYLWLRSSQFLSGINPGRSKGVPHISTREVERLQIEVPPRNEQAEIVGLVDRLLMTVAALQANLSMLDSQRAQLARALSTSLIAYA
jgi:Restriction endonuclease S subunits